jgi:hypothetical protein
MGSPEHALGRRAPVPGAPGGRSASPFLPGGHRRGCHHPGLPARLLPGRPLPELHPHRRGMGRAGGDGPGDRRPADPGGGDHPGAPGLGSGAAGLLDGARGGTASSTAATRTPSLP